MCLLNLGKTFDGQVVSDTRKWNIKVAFCNQDFCTKFSVGLKRPHKKSNKLSDDWMNQLEIRIMVKPVC